MNKPIGMLVLIFSTVCIVAGALATDGEYEIFGWIVVAIGIGLLHRGFKIFFTRGISANDRKWRRIWRVVGMFFAVLIAAFLASGALAVVGALVWDLVFEPSSMAWLFWTALAVACPWGLWRWWWAAKVLLSESVRGVAFSDEQDSIRFRALTGLPRRKPKRRLERTRKPRPGTALAGWRLRLALFGNGVVLFLFALLGFIPVLGWLLSMVFIDRYIAFVGPKMDNLNENLARLLAPTMDEVLEGDGREPVLLLRSFFDDALEMNSLDGERRNVDKVSFEQVVARVVEDWGPLVAIGAPGETAPLLGAARAYFSNDTWQENAVALLKRSRVVILVMGPTPSVAWELERILVDRFAEKTIVLLPPTHEPGYILRVEKLSEIFAFKNMDWLADELPYGHYLLAAVFSEGRAIPISGVARESLFYEDALALASRVVNQNAQNAP